MLFTLRLFLQKHAVAVGLFLKGNFSLKWKSVCKDSVERIQFDQLDKPLSSAVLDAGTSSSSFWFQFFLHTFYLHTIKVRTKREQERIMCKTETRKS